MHHENRIFIIGERQTAAELKKLLQENGHQCSAVFPHENLSVQLAQIDPLALTMVSMENLSQEALSQLIDLQVRKQIRLICVVSRKPTEPLAYALVQSAADFIRTPIDPEELQLRVQRLALSPPPALAPDPARRRITPLPTPAKTRHRRRNKRLTETEAQIVAALEENVGAIVELDTLCDLVSGGSLEQRINSVRVHILRLRHKVEPDPRRPQYILTVRAQGYVLTEPVTHRLPQ